MHASTVRLRHDQIDDAGALLARALHHDPLQMYVLPDDRERAHRAPAQFAALVRLGHLYGEVRVTSGALQGASVWLPPGAKMTHDRLHASGLDGIDATIGARAAERLAHVMSFVVALHERAVPTDHWYLLVIGVDPDLQRSGIGSALIRPMLQRADADGVPCYLESAQPANVPFYERLGFRVMADVVEPRARLRVWTYRRDPAPAR